MSVQSKEQRLKHRVRGHSLGYVSDTIMCRYCHLVIAVVSRRTGLDLWSYTPGDSLVCTAHHACKRAHDAIEAKLKYGDGGPWVP